MRTANKLILTMGSAMLISSSVAVADPPTAFGQYNYLDGAITIVPTTPSGSDATCPDTFTCGAAITGPGFYQRQITDSSGEKYFQTIVAPLSASASESGITFGAGGTQPLDNLSFNDEDFVKLGGGTGIADKQSIFSASTTANPGDFHSSVAINAGWAKANAAQNAIDLHQTVDDTVNAFNVDFQLQDASTDNSAPVITLREDVSLYTAGNPNSGVNDKQVFYLKQLKAASADSTTLANALPVDTISWTTGQLIQAMWLGQKVTSGSAGSVQAFGVQSYTNVDKLNASQPDPTMSYADLNAIGSAGAAATGPGTWWDTTPFGTAPTF